MQKKSWKDLQDAGLLWFINRTLHIFGWAIVLETLDDGTVVDAYPARTRWRGFAPETEDEGFEKLTQYMHDASEDLLKDLKPE